MWTNGPIFDISPALSPALAAWPGDLVFSRSVSQDMARGDALRLSAIRVSLHAGSHVDAPSHFERDGASIEQLALDTFVGPCEVVEVGVKRNACIGSESLPAALSGPRILLKTSTRPDERVFNEDFAGLAPELAGDLASRGCRLVGIDTPSVDVFQATALPAHHALAAAGIAILEGLRLAAVPAGRYVLVALPLRVLGGEASPVRAVLLPWQGP
jgi:arylformamidase